MINTRELLVFVVLCAVISIASTAEEVEIDDMLLTKDQWEQDFEGKRAIGRNGLISNETHDYRWPNKVVPLGWDIFLSTPGRRLVIAAANIIEEGSCIKFKLGFDIINTPNYVFVRNDSINQCKAHVGYQKIGRQIMEWSPQCNFVHSLLHVLGFYHMHQTPIRDEYIKINLDYMEPRFRKNMYKLHSDKASLYNTPYDYISILHYNQYIFTQKPGIWKTIIPLKGDRNTPGVMGQQLAWSAGDKKRLNNMYNCPPKNNG